MIESSPTVVSTKVGGSTKKYLFYAIGEIALVVIGILIALQINNWNEKRIEKNSSIEYHERLIDDLDLVVNHATADGDRADKIFKSIKTSISILESKILADSSKQILDYMLINFYQYIPLDASLPTYDEMKSSGNIGLIYDPELRNKIARYLGYSEAVSKIYDVIVVDLNDTDFIDPYLRIDLADPSMQSVKYDFNDLVSDPLVINTFSKFGTHWRGKAIWSKYIATQAHSLKDAITESLENL